MNNAKNITVSSATAANSSSVMRRLKRTVAKLAKNRGLNVDEVRQQLIDKIKLLNQTVLPWIGWEISRPHTWQ